MKRARAKSVFKRGVCRKCGQKKPVSQFSPRSTGEPEWYPHHPRCRECVNEAAKESYRRKWLAMFEAELPGRSEANLKGELKFLQAKVRMLREELRSRE